MTNTNEMNELCELNDESQYTIKRDEIPHLILSLLRDCTNKQLELNLGRSPFIIAEHIWNIMVNKNAICEVVHDHNIHKLIIRVNIPCEEFPLDTDEKKEGSDINETILITLSAAFEISSIVSKPFDDAVRYLNAQHGQFYESLKFHILRMKNSFANVKKRAQNNLKASTRTSSDFDGDQLNYLNKKDFTEQYINSQQMTQALHALEIYFKNFLKQYDEHLCSQMIAGLTVPANYNQSIHEVLMDLKKGRTVFGQQEKHFDPFEETTSSGGIIAQIATPDFLSYPREKDVMFRIVQHLQIILNNIAIFLSWVERNVTVPDAREIITTKIFKLRADVLRFIFENIDLDYCPEYFTKIVNKHKPY